MALSEWLSQVNSTLVPFIWQGLNAGGGRGGWAEFHPNLLQLRKSYQECAVDCRGKIAYILKGQRNKR